MVSYLPDKETPSMHAGTHHLYGFHHTVDTFEWAVEHDEEDSRTRAGLETAEKATNIIVRAQCKSRRGS